MLPPPPPPPPQLQQQQQQLHQQQQFLTMSVGLWDVDRPKLFPFPLSFTEIEAIEFPLDIYFLTWNWFVHYY